MIVWDIDVVTVLTFVVATVLPLLVAIVSTKETSSLRKGLLLAALSFVTGLLSGILDALVSGSEYRVGEQLATLLEVFVWAVASYFGIWRAARSDGKSIASRLTRDGPSSS